MAFDTDELEPQKKKKPVLKDLQPMSIADLEDYIVDLQGEVGPLFSGLLFRDGRCFEEFRPSIRRGLGEVAGGFHLDRKSTRMNSSH